MNHAAAAAPDVGGAAAIISAKPMSSAPWIRPSMRAASMREGNAASRRSSATASPVTSCDKTHLRVRRLVCLLVDLDAFVGAHQREWTRLEELVRLASSPRRLTGRQV